MRGARAPAPMTVQPATPGRGAWQELLSPARLTVCAGLVLLWTLCLLPLWRSELLALFSRNAAAGLSAWLVWALIERWPVSSAGTERRWPWQLLGISLSIPLVLAIAYLIDTDAGQPPLWRDAARLTSYYVISLSGVLIALVAALLVLLRRSLSAIDGLQALHGEALALMERQAVEGQLRMLRGQLKPDFLLRLIGDARDLAAKDPDGSMKRLDELLGFLRDSLPRLDAPRSNLAAELNLARSFLAVEAGRRPLPPRLLVDLPEECEQIACPPCLLLALVERAVRRGGRKLDLWVRQGRDRCVLRLSAELSGHQPEQRADPLPALRRRLSLAWSEEVSLQCWTRESGEEVVEVDFPAAAAD